MNAEPMHFSLSLDLVSWRANLWVEERCHSNEEVSERDHPMTLHEPVDEQPDNAPTTETCRFVRKPIRVVYTPRRSKNG
jgi:hypothetical protein